MFVTCRGGRVRQLVDRRWVMAPPAPSPLRREGDFGVARGLQRLHLAQPAAELGAPDEEGVGGGSLPPLAREGRVRVGPFQGTESGRKKGGDPPQDFSAASSLAFSSSVSGVTATGEGLRRRATTRR